MKFILLTLFSLTTVLISGCGKQSADETTETSLKGEYTKLSAKEAKEMLDEDETIILLDVRTEEEFKEIRIEGALLIPDFELKKRAKSELPDKDAKILVYCRSGARSNSAANLLINMGYTNVFDFGGINAYPYETISD